MDYFFFFLLKNYFFSACFVFVGDHVRHRTEVEVKRMGFDTQNIWRVSDINCNYKYVTETLP